MSYLVGRSTRARGEGRLYAGDTFACSDEICIQSCLMAPLELVIEPSDSPAWSLPISSPTVAIAGFTGRDPDAVRDHIRELEEIGVPAPSQVPAVYTVPDWVLAQGSGEIQVPSDRGSGEAEPVLVALPDGAIYVTVGSDHTDRDLERASVELAKLTHPKVLGRTAWPFSELASEWDELVLRSWVGEQAELYQEASLGAIAKPLELLEHVRGVLRPPPDRPLIVFLGTVPLRSEGFSFDGWFTAALEDPERARRLVCTYSVTPIGSLPRVEAA